MFPLLCANWTGGPPPWWVSAFVVPLIVGVAAALVTVFAGIWTVRRTEWYRRLSRWEPFAEKRWCKQVELYATICQAAQEAHIRARQYVFTSGRDEPETEPRLLEAYQEAKRTLSSLDAQRVILLRNQFNVVFGDFDKNLFMFTTTPKDCPDVRVKERCYEYADSLLKLHTDLFDSARQSLGIDVLDDKARQAIRTGLEEIGK
jgi:hypothetical protein